eukprot:8036733-Pyramimonas_sp.AAC.1
MQKEAPVLRHQRSRGHQVGRGKVEELWPEVAADSVHHGDTHDKLAPPRELHRDGTPNQQGSG